MKILVIRFRQMGDAILATPLLSALRQNYPDAEIDFVLNERIAPLFEGHPALSRIITFSDHERHSAFIYIRKVWQVVHQTHYDVIIDMRSTVNTMLFALFSLRGCWRIGIRKPYTWGVFNRRIEACEDDESMIDHNLKLVPPSVPPKGGRMSPIPSIPPKGGRKSPIPSIPPKGGRKSPIHSVPPKGERYSSARQNRLFPPSGGQRGVKGLSLFITDQERQDFRQYMAGQGIDFSRPVLLVGVTAKLAHKTWPEDRMTEVLRRLIEAYPRLQLIFNYAPGKEAENAQRIHARLLSSAATPSQPLPVFLNIQAKTPRQLAAMAANCTAYFGNEGGGRHIVHAMGRPSLVICSPGASKTTWLPQDTDVLALGIDAASYDLITVDRVWLELQSFLNVILPSNS